MAPGNWTSLVPFSLSQFCRDRQKQFSVTWQGPLYTIRIYRRGTASLLPVITHNVVLAALTSHKTSHWSNSTKQQGHP